MKLFNAHNVSNEILAYQAMHTALTGQEPSTADLARHFTRLRDGAEHEQIRAFYAEIVRTLESEAGEGASAPLH